MYMTPEEEQKKKLESTEITRPRSAEKPTQEFPESSLVRNSFTIRKMDLPPSVQLTKRSLLRWFALSFGLISEKESRSTVLSVLDALFYYLLAQQQNPSTIDLQNYIFEKKEKKISEKLIRYHLKKLIDINLLLRKSNRYYFNAPPYAEPSLKESFSHWVKEPINSSLTDIETILLKINDNYQKPQL